MIKIKEGQDEYGINRTKLIVSVDLLTEIYDCLKEGESMAFAYENNPAELIYNMIKNQEEDCELSFGFLYELLKKMDPKDKHLPKGCEEMSLYHKYLEDEQAYYDFMDTDLKTSYIKLLKNKKTDSLEKAIRLQCALKKDQEDLFLLRDLLVGRDELLEDMRYVCTEEEFDYFRTYLKNTSYDIDNLKVVLKVCKEKVLKNWQQELTDISTYHTNEAKPFSLLCHSVLNSTFEGEEFYTKYVSTSLLTEQLWDTYSRGFGYILSPEHIVAASSKDLYASNYAQTDDKLFFHTKVAPIYSKKRIEKECLMRKQISRCNFKKTKVYSEILIKGFQPIGIFCITDGSKMDYNFKSAMRLKEQIDSILPNLPVIELDKTLYVSTEEQKSFIQPLLENLQKETGVHRDFSAIEDYQVMFYEFIKEKKEGIYHPEDLKRKYIAISKKEEVVDNSSLHR